MSLATARKYRSPTRSAYVDVSLEEFDTQELIAELKHRGSGDDLAADFGSSVDDGYFIDPEMLSRVSTLVLCGQRDSAAQELCRALEPIVGRLLP